MTITYQREAVARIILEMTALTQAHWAEVAHNQDSRKLDPDWDTFKALDAAGQSFLMTARMDGELVGYVFAILRPHLHSKGTQTAYVDAIFLSPQARRNNTGLRLLQLTDSALSQVADFVYWHVKPERDFSPLLKRMGYEFIESIWGRAPGAGA